MEFRFFGVAVDILLAGIRIEIETVVARPIGGVVVEHIAVRFTIAPFEDELLNPEQILAGDCILFRADFANP